MAMVASMKTHNIPVKLDGVPNNNTKDELDTLLENLAKAPSSSKGSTGSTRPEVNNKCEYRHNEEQLT